MYRFKTHLAAASVMACFVAPASAEWPIDGGNGKSLNGISRNAVTSNAVTSNAVTSNGIGLYALNGVRIEGIVLAKSTGRAGKSIIDPNIRSLPAVQNSTIDKSVVDPNDSDLLDQNDPIEMWIELND